MILTTLITLAATVWLLSCGASLMALYWNVIAGMQRWRAAFGLSCIALLIGYLGWSRIQLHASKTVNGHLEWSFNSRWFFIVAMVLGAVALAWSIWNWRKARVRPAQATGTAV